MTCVHNLTHGLLFLFAVSLQAGERVVFTFPSIMGLPMSYLCFPQIHSSALVTLYMVVLLLCPVASETLSVNCWLLPLNAPLFPPVL